MAARQYELILYGATGYTGKYTAIFLQKNAPTDLKWAIAGRNAQKLKAVADELKGLGIDRDQPGVEVVNHEPQDLKNLASKTKVLISTVGPYFRYGTPVVQACVESKTHYLDVTGEIPWVYEVIEKFNATAQSNKTILLPQCGVDSVPSDMLAYSLARYIRDQYNEGTDNCVASIQSASGSLSGGTAETALSIGSAYPISFLMKTMKPWALSPIAPASIQKRSTSPHSIISRILGFVNIRDLGYLTAWPSSSIDIPIVHRSWGLFGGPNGMYGKQFQFNLLFRAKTVLAAIIQAQVIRTLSLLMILPPGRWLLKRFVHPPGEGASAEESAKHFMKYKAVATSDSGKRVSAKLNLMASLYHFTGVFVATAALEILRGDGKSRAVREGGVVTSAMLEQGFADRLEKGGAKITVEPL